MGTVATFTVLFVASRWLAWNAGLGPDIEIVLGHWQHADLKLLDQQYWRTLWYQHSQPPLWNALIGLAVNLTENDSATVSAALHGLFMVLSWGCGLLLVDICRKLGFGPVLALLSAVLLMVSPSVFYYENYVFYPHPSFVLMTVLLWALVSRSTAIALAALVALAWLWAIFHPVFVLLAGVAVLWSGGRLHGRRGVLVLALTTFVAALPTIKNAAVFGVPTASSWAGMNLAQTAFPEGSVERRECDFYLVHQRIWRNNPPGTDDRFPSLSDTLKSSGHANMNHVGMMDRAQTCMDLAVGAIVANPFTWLTDLARRIDYSHRKPAFDYFFDPKGWEVFAGVERLLERTSPQSRRIFAAMHGVLAVWCLLQALFGRNRRVHATILLILAYFTFASHAGNGAEQERMRYTIMPLYWFLLVGLLLQVVRLLRWRPGAGTGT